MTTIKSKDYTGYSDIDLEDAITIALKKAQPYQHVKIIETKSSSTSIDVHRYQVTLTTFID